MAGEMSIGEIIRAARKNDALSQSDLAKKLDVTQATVSNWEIGKSGPDKIEKERLQSILGADIFLQEPVGQVSEHSAFAAWLQKARQEADLTVAELAVKSELSQPLIYNIENGRAQNPRLRTIERLEKALGKKFGKEFQDEVRKENTVEGIGEFHDFDPHSRDDWPNEAGIYVFYDVS